MCRHTSGAHMGLNTLKENYLLTRYDMLAIQIITNSRLTDFKYLNLYIKVFVIGNHQSVLRRLSVVTKLNLNE